MKREMMSMIAVFAILFIGMVSCQSVLPDSSGTTTVELSQANFPVSNPLKGFLRYSNPAEEGDGTKATIVNDIPISMEWFYLPLTKIVVGENTYDWSALETRLSEIAGRGHQAAMRFYVDDPDKASAIPGYLLQKGLKTYQYKFFGNGTKFTSVAPDWNDANLISCLVNFIKALGARFDGDPRIGYITAGLVGFWGEWHTWPQDGWTPYNANDYAGADHALAADGVDRLKNWMANDANKNLILHACNDSFSKTLVQLRNPYADSGKLKFGYHDDSFAWETLDPEFDPKGGQSWMFWGNMKNGKMTENWKTFPMGGELRPEIQTTMWNYDPPRYKGGDSSLGSDGQDYYTCVKVTHPTWLIMHMPFVNAVSGKALDAIKTASSKLGYVFYVPVVVKSALIDNSKDWSVDVTVRNLGVAPFYYPWLVQLGLKNEAGDVVKTWDTNWDLRTVQPGDFGGEDVVFNFKGPKIGLNKAGKYSLVMRVVNPLEKISANASRLLFANKSQNEDGWLLIQ
jgi:hypothetical protein